VALGTPDHPERCVVAFHVSDAAPSAA
jgi:hypothetical protein